MLGRGTVGGGLEKRIWRDGMGWEGKVLRL